MSELTQSFQWIVSTMRGDSALMAAAVGGVWEQFADISTPMPYVLIVAQVAGVDSLTSTAKRVMNRQMLQLKAIGPTSNYAALITIADRIDVLFKDVRNVGLPAGVMLTCFREQILAYGEIVNGAAFSHLGGLYHIDVQGS